MTRARPSFLFLFIYCFLLTTDAVVDWTCGASSTACIESAEWEPMQVHRNGFT